MRRFERTLFVVALSTVAIGCDDKAAPTPAAPAATATEAPAVAAPPPQPKGPPEFSVSAGGAKIGWTYFGGADTEKKLGAEIAEDKEFVAGKNVAVNVDRQAKLGMVATMLHALEDGGATSMTITTDSRPEYPKTVTFVTRAAGRSAPECSVVAEVLAERKNAVWSLRGGTAIKSSKGLAGPDMVVTADHLQSAAKRCKESSFVFVSAEEGVEWGLVYDLAAASQVLEKAKLDKVVLLYPAPIAGRPVKVE